jgi:hypothetical protein
MKNNKGLLLEIATKGLFEVTEYNVEKCLQELKERKTRINLNRAVKGKMKIIINRNERNEDLMIKYIAEILSGYINKDEGSGSELEYSYNDKSFNLEYRYKEHIIKTVISNNQIIREIIAA